MKTLIIISLLFISQAFSQNNADSIKFSQRIPAELIMEMKVQETGAIGYAYCFRGEVLSVLKGNISDKKLLITAMDTQFYNMLSRAGEDDILQISFVFNKANEPYSTTFVTGFVDSDKNSWRITSIEKK